MQYIKYCFVIASQSKEISAAHLTHNLCAVSPKRALNLAVPMMIQNGIINAVSLIKILVGYVLIRKGIWISNLAEETEETIERSK